MPPPLNPCIYELTNKLPHPSSGSGRRIQPSSVFPPNGYFTLFLTSTTPPPASSSPSPAPSVCHPLSSREKTIAPCRGCPRLLPPTLVRRGPSTAWLVVSCRPNGGSRRLCILWPQPIPSLTTCKLQFSLCGVTKLVRVPSWS